MKKILYISDVPSHPIQGGNLQSMQAYVNALKELDFEIFFFFGYDPYFSCPKFYIEGTKKYWGDHFFGYRQSLLIAFFQKVLKKIDRTLLVIFDKYSYKIDRHYLFGMNRALRKIQKQQQFDIIFINYIWNTKACEVFPHARKVLFTHDAFTFRRYRTGDHCFFSTSPKEEGKALNRCDAILSVQENESNFFRTLTDKEVYTSYSPLSGHLTPFCGNKSILYIGSNISFNIESIHNFVKYVLPPITDRFPEFKIYIGGSICMSFESTLNDPHIVLLGSVEDIDYFYNLGDIIINPTENGSGLKIKSIEALAYNKILISHPHSVEGLYDPENLPVDIASTPAEFVDIILDYFKNPKKIQKKKINVAIYMEKYNTFVQSQIQAAFSPNIF